MADENFNREIAEFMGEMRNEMKNTNSILAALPCRDKNFCPAAVVTLPFNWRKWAIGCLCIGLGIGVSLSVGWQGMATLIKLMVES